MHPVQRIGDLVGEELSEVAFVRDYVEFHFDGPVLRALADPEQVGPEAAHFVPGPNRPMLIW